MNRTQFTIDLRRLSLTEKQIKSIHTAIHETVAAELIKIKAPSKRKGKPAFKAAIISATANIQVTFTNTNPGMSRLTAILKGKEQTITESNTITIDQVEPGNIILIQGESLGTTTATIDLDATPTQMNFPPGSFDGVFYIN